MGGLAIKNAFTRRYKKDEFEKILPIILEKTKKLFSDAKSTTYFKSKESFGDADILCLIDKPITVDLKKWIIDEFNSKEVFINGSCYSFEFNELQVDFILIPLSNWETSQVYYAYNDIWNLIGKCAHSFNLKMGYDGLRYVYRIDGKVLGEITLSKEHRKSLTFLGFDPDRYDKGFENLDEIFDFVTSSKYFNPWKYDLENLNKINRDRDKKRATYIAFIRHVEPMKEKGKDAYHYFYPDKKVYLGMIDAAFPGFLKQYRALELKEERLQAISALYNGRIIMEYFDLAGKALGAAMTNFERQFDDKNEMHDWILEQNDTKIIMNFFADANCLTFKNDSII